VKKRFRISTGVVLALVVALTVAVPAVFGAANTQIPLTPSKAFPRATGSAQVQVQSTQREFQVEVEHIRTLAGRKVLVYVAGSKIGAARVNRLGIAELTRNTERGQQVPMIGAGTAVSVWTSRGSLVVLGTF
jgi:hypothetical protein